MNTDRDDALTFREFHDRPFPADVNEADARALISELFDSGDWWLMIHYPPSPGTRALTGEIFELHYGSLDDSTPPTWIFTHIPGRDPETPEAVIEAFARSEMTADQLGDVMGRHPTLDQSHGGGRGAGGHHQLHFLSTSDLDISAAVDWFLVFLNN